MAVKKPLFMPLVGLGTWELQGKECEKVISKALEIGYRHIDTAEIYENHKAVGKAIKAIDRKELFLTSKIPLDHIREKYVEKDVQKLCDKALNELKVDYLDLYLIHWPDRTMPMDETYEAMEKLVKQKKVRHIGVSNYTIHHLQDLQKKKIPIEVNQVEFHPYLYQEELWKFCKKNDITLISYRSLGKGALLKDAKLKALAKMHGKSVAQIILRWLIQKNIPVIPKASSEAHLQENFSIFDFALDKKQMVEIESLHKNKRFCGAEDEEFLY